MTTEEAVPCGLYAPVHPDGRPAICSTAWVTETVVAMARGIRADEAFDRLPILVDALEEAGCDDLLLLGHCRFCQRHVSGCWAVEAVMEGFDCAQPLILPIPPKPTVAGRVFDALVQELRITDPGVVRLPRRQLPTREHQLIRAGCVAVIFLPPVLLVTIFLLSLYFRR